MATTISKAKLQIPEVPIPTSTIVAAGQRAFKQAVDKALSLGRSRITAEEREWKALRFTSPPR